MLIVDQDRALAGQEAIQVSLGRISSFSHGSERQMQIMGSMVLNLLNGTHTKWPLFAT